MVKYVSKCRYNMLIFVEGRIREIRPGEVFESNEDIILKYIEKEYKLPKKNNPKIIKKQKIAKETLDASTT
jgi:hypothetical protein